MRQLSCRVAKVTQFAADAVFSVFYVSLLDYLIFFWSVRLSKRMPSCLLLLRLSPHSTTDILGQKLPPWA